MPIMTHPVQFPKGTTSMTVRQYLDYLGKWDYICRPNVGILDEDAILTDGESVSLGKNPEEDDEAF